MAKLYQKIDGEAVPLGGGGGGGSVAIDNVTITKNSDDEIQVATALTDKIDQLNNTSVDQGKVLTANGDGTASWDDILVPIDNETITKNNNGELQVSSMPYDNTESGLTADNVQDAIDEVNSGLEDLEDSINNVIDITSNVSLTSVISTTWDGELSVKRLGNLVSVCITKMLATSITNDQEVYATGFPKPLTSVIINDSYANNNGDFNRLCLESSTGNLRNNWSVQSRVTSGSTIQGTFCYITNDPM